MLFNSIEFLIFLPIVLTLYWLSGHTLQNRLLLAASYVFYGLWDIRFLFLIVLSTGIDYLIGLLIDRGKITRSQYWKATSWIFGSAIVYLVILWPSGDLNFSGSHSGRSPEVSVAVCVSAGASTGASAPSATLS